MLLLQSLQLLAEKDVSFLPRTQSKDALTVCQTAGFPKQPCLGKLTLLRLYLKVWWGRSKQERAAGSRYASVTL